MKRFIDREDRGQGSLLPVAAIREYMKKSPKTLLVVAELLFLCSLFLPAIENRVFGKAERWEGWRAAGFAIWSLGDILKDEAPVALGVAGAGNLVFLVAPLLFFRVLPIVAFRVFCGAVICSLAFALWAAAWGGLGPSTLLVGYFVWLMAYIALLGSSILLCQKDA
jgi:hypothetical protein